VEEIGEVTAKVNGTDTAIADGNNKEVTNGMPDTKDIEKETADATEELNAAESLEDVESESDDDAIQFIGEEASVQHTYEKLKNLLDEEWKKTIIDTIQNVKDSMKQDTDETEDLSLRREMARRVRIGQNIILNKVIEELSS